MKKFNWRFIVAVIILLGLYPLHGQVVQRGTSRSAKEERKLAAALRNYQTCLHSEVEGVIESAIFHTLIVRLKAPQEDYSKLIGELQRLAFAAGSPRLRYQAYLGANILANAEQFLDAAQSEHLQTFTDDRRAEFFALIAATLENQLSDL